MLKSTASEEILLLRVAVPGVDYNDLPSFSVLLKDGGLSESATARASLQLEATLTEIVVNATFSFG